MGPGWRRLAGFDRTTRRTRVSIPRRTYVHRAERPTGVCGDGELGSNVVGVT